MGPAVLLLAFAVLALLALLVLEAMALARWTGAWRVAAAMPALALLVVVASIVLAVRRDPTSHNLWPLEIAAWVVGGLAAMILLFAVRRLRVSQG